MKSITKDKLYTSSLLSVLFLLAATITILASVPPISRDALTHHLAIPKLYLKHGGIYEIPDRPFSYYPMNLDLLYLFPLSFGNDIIPNLIHFSFALMTAWLIYNYLKKRTDSIHGLIGALFFLSIPVIVKLSITAYVDLGLIFFSTAALLFLFRWRETSKKNWLILSAVMCGLAMGIKYNGLISFMLLMSFVPIIYLGKTRKRLFDQCKSLGYGLLFSLIAIIIFSPWMVRNYIWTKNPVYPLFSDRFQSSRVTDSDTDPKNIKEKSPSNLAPFAIRKVVYQESWWKIALVPIRIFFEGQDDNPKLFDGKLNPFLCLLPLLALLFRSGNDGFPKTEKKILALFSVLFLFISFFLADMRIRYIGPILPPLVILSMIGLFQIKKVLSEHVYKQNKGVISILVFLSLVFLFLINFLYIAKQLGHLEPIPYITGSINRNEYIEKYWPEYAAIRYLNENISTDSKILALFIGDRGYYFEREIFFGKNELQKNINKSESPRSILMFFKRFDISYILVREDLFINWIQTSFNDEAKTNFLVLFQHHLKPVFSKAGFKIFQVAI
ncbi:MAG: glycosyltransferase family 39 protein [Pseudomonadota bacterium]